MGSTTALWFRIEETFAEIHELCAEARACALVVKSAERERNLVGALSRGTLPLEEFDATGTTAERYPRALELAADPAFREAHPEGADLVALRSKLRKQFSRLKTNLSEVLSDHEVYFALFPIVVYADELINVTTQGKSERWEPLQSELYDVDNGGELFYTFLEERMRQEETHPIVFEVFYFCLKDGFTGQYASEPKKIEEYTARLADKIPVRDAERVVQREPRPIELIRFPYRYYVAAAGGIAAMWLVLWLLSPSF